MPSRKGTKTTDGDDEGPDKERVAFYISSPLAHALRIQCAVAKVRQSAAAEEALRDWLVKQGVKPPAE